MSSERRPTSDGQITAWFGDTRIPRERVLDWEAKRARKGLERLGAPVPTGDVLVLREALAAAKAAAGRSATERTLARQISFSDRLTGRIAKASGARRAVSQVELFGPGIRAADLPDWYMQCSEADDENVFLRACPDHHLFRPTGEGTGQEVWETTGGSPFASRFFFTLGETDGLVTPIDPTYPVQMAGIARLADGTVIGGLRHQFRDEGDGTRALLTVEMPWLIGPYTPRAHRWHLACEFSGWMEAAAS